MVYIFGKDSCPYTQAARDDYESRGVTFQYVNVKKDPAELARMLKFSGGRREVPVIVDGDAITIGFAGRYLRRLIGPREGQRRRATSALDTL